MVNAGREHKSRGTTPSFEELIQLCKKKPADVFLEDCISLPPVSSAPDLKNKPLLGGSPGGVKLGAFISQKFGIQPTITLKFMESGFGAPSGVVGAAQQQQQPSWDDSVDGGFGGVPGDGGVDVTGTGGKRRLEERTLFFPGNRFLLLIEAVIPFMRRCDRLLEGLGREFREGGSF